MTRARSGRERQLLEARIGVIVMASICVLSGCATGTPTSSATPSPTRSGPTATGSPTTSSSPTPDPSAYLHTAAEPPPCPQSPSESSVCAVALPSGPSNYNVSGGEYILFRSGWGDPEEQSCRAFVSGTTTTMTVDGQAVALTAIPCQLIPPGGQPSGVAGNWFTDLRYLSPPMSPGTHTAMATVTYNTAVPGACGPSDKSDTPNCTTPAGTVQRFSKTVTVT